MIAIGGAIGTGLFVASGSTISQAGPGGALAAYALVGLMVFLLMQSLGEMSAKIPVAGSFQSFATRFVSPSFGFAIGWNYWFNWAITVAAELVAAGIIMDFWFPGVPGWVWAGIFLLVLTGLNALSAKSFGESEFWLSLIKVSAVVLFLIAGVLMIFGILGDNSPGLSNWENRDDVFHGGWVSIISVFMVAGFSFQGTELVGVAAGEAKNPRREVPKAIRTVFWRIMLFYIGAIFIIGCLIPFTDPSLLASGESDIAASPFTLVFSRAGIAFAAALMNAVILTAILSAGNSGLYASTRMLYAMAHDGMAPKIFGRDQRAWCADRGVARDGHCGTLRIPLRGRRPGCSLLLAAEHVGPVRLHRLGGNRGSPSIVSGAASWPRETRSATCRTKHPCSPLARCWPSPCSSSSSRDRTTRLCLPDGPWRCFPPTSGCQSSSFYGWLTASSPSPKWCRCSRWISRHLRTSRTNLGAPPGNQARRSEAGCEQHPASLLPIDQRRCAAAYRLADT